MNTPIEYVPKFVDDADGAFRALWNELSWQRRGSTPRREYYANEAGVPYTYGKGMGRRSYDPSPWHPVMLQIREKLEQHTGTKFEVCFLNGYENQRDHLGWHADDSPEMDDTRPIAIVSLGSEREIWFREQGETRPGAAVFRPSSLAKLKLEHGSLCLMAPGMQDTHYHRIPKAGFDCGERISLTFRGYVSQ